MTDGIGFKKQFNDRLVWLESLLNPLWCNLMSRHALKKKKKLQNAASQAIAYYLLMRKKEMFNWTDLRIGTNENEVA